MLTAYGVSDAGLVRKGNEDGFICSPSLRLYAVADGMGGHLAGEVASRVALEALEAFVRRTREDSDITWPFGFDPQLTLGANRLRTAIHLANRLVFEASESRDDCAGMGTTITATLASNDGLAFGHAGDSRLYVLEAGGFRQLTRDDSWVATVLAHDPTVSPSDLACHPMRHVLTNVLGARQSVEVQVGEIPFHGEQLFLLCSDGLHGLVEDGEIHRIMESGGSLEQMGAQLVQAALDRGGHDNVTAVLIRHGSAP